MITLDKKNVRTHPDGNKAAIKNSLSELGAGRSILLDKDDVLIAGNGVYEQAAALGLPVRTIETDGTELIAVKRTDLSTDDEKRIALAIADNRLTDLSEFDTEALNVMLDELSPDMQELAGYAVDPNDLMNEGNTDEDEVPEVTEATCKLGDLWILGNHRLLCGDSTDKVQVEKLMDGEKADMVFTDPPYNIDFKPQRGTHEKILNDSMSEDAFELFLSRVFKNCKAVLNPDTYVISFMGWPTTHNFRKALIENFEIKSMPIWKKNNFGIGYYTRPQYEPMFLCLNGDPVKPQKAPSDVFDYAKVHKTIHSCEKPVGLIVEIIDNFNRNGLFYEPFLGSGSTLIACEKTNRRCFGMELDPGYCDVIIERWQNYTGETAVKHAI